MIAENILSDLNIGIEHPIVAYYPISNKGGVVIYYMDSECVLAKYFDEEPTIADIEYGGQEWEDHFFFSIGSSQMEIPINQCVRIDW